MIPHLKERIEYARDELAWLEAGAKEGEEPWRGWKTGHPDSSFWPACIGPPQWLPTCIYRRRPKMLHVIDAKGVRHEFPAPMREAPEYRSEYYFVGQAGGIYKDTWDNLPSDKLRLAAGLCQSTQEGAQQQIAALRAVCLGGDV